MIVTLDTCFARGESNMKRQSSFTSTDTDPESCASPPGEYETAGKVRGINYVHFPSPMPSHLQIYFSPLFPKYFTSYKK